MPGFLAAVIYVPEGSAPRPLVVASHGAGGIPEWECEYWLRLTGGQAFVLCPRGARTDMRGPSGYYYPTHYALEREVVSAVSAARAAFGPRLLPSSGIYAGFSQGAIMGAPMIPRHGAEFPYLVLIEGGYEYWSMGQARTFAARGGKRVLFVCGTRWCADKSSVPAAWLRHANVEVRIEYAPGAGHTSGGAVMDRVLAALPWVRGDDPNWRP